MQVSAGLMSDWDADRKPINQDMSPVSTIPDATCLCHFSDPTLHRQQRYPQVQARVEDHPLGRNEWD